MDMIVDVFKFLCTDFGFVISETYSPFKKSKKDVVIYRNGKTNIQINISAKNNSTISNSLNIEVFKMYYGTSVCYSDFDNCFKYLIFLKLDNIQQESVFWGFDCNQSELFHRAANLLRKHKSFFTTEEWRDEDLFDQLKLYALKNNYKFEPFWKYSLPPYKQLFFDKMKAVFKSHNYDMSYNSFELPSFARDDNYERLEFTKLKENYLIRQHDFRDSQEDTYSIYLNNKWLITFDIISLKSAEKAIIEIEKKIKD